MTSIDFYYLKCLYFTIIIFLHFRYFFRFFRVIFWLVLGSKVHSKLFWGPLISIIIFMSNSNVLHTLPYFDSPTDSQITPSHRISADGTFKNILVKDIFARILILILAAIRTLNDWYLLKTNIICRKMLTHLSNHSSLLGFLTFL